MDIMLPKEVKARLLILEKKIHLLRLEGVPSDLLRIPKADPIR